ncbi:MAG: HAMP domain-containing sensor histidine kinase [Candidatus Poribacteria bacterium]|nr:HAMP domain-containing sensor histidine kinase [Candidatus Poribacteria bacterium]
MKDEDRTQAQAIHELEALEAEHQQAQIMQQERLSAIGRTAGGIVHEFNNVLMTILGFTDLLLNYSENLDDKEKVTQYLRLMSSSAQEAATTSRRLREFYRQRAPNEDLESVNLNALVMQTIESSQSKWKSDAEASGITINIETELQEIPLIAGNETELREALTSLVLNAVEAMPQGGTITVRTGSDNDSVFLEVSDTGIGMTEEIRPYCFEPFFSTKGRQNAGLGLAVVYGIVQRHDGMIEVESEPDVGTTFRIHLTVQAEQ